MKQTKLKITIKCNIDANVKNLQVFPCRNADRQGPGKEVSMGGKELQRRPPANGLWQRATEVVEWQCHLLDLGPVVPGGRRDSPREMIGSNIKTAQFCPLSHGTGQTSREFVCFVKF